MLQLKYKHFSYYECKEVPLQILTMSWLFTTHHALLSSHLLQYDEMLAQHRCLRGKNPLFDASPFQKSHSSEQMQR